MRIQMSPDAHSREGLKTEQWLKPKIGIVGNSDISDI